MSLRNEKLDVIIRKADKTLPHQIEKLEKNYYEVKFTPETIERHFIDILLNGVIVNSGKSQRFNISFIILKMNFFFKMHLIK